MTPRYQEEGKLMLDAARRFSQVLRLTQYFTMVPSFIYTKLYRI